MDPSTAIRRAMKDHLLRQADLARILKCHQTVISRILTHKRHPSIPMIRALNKKLGIPLEHLVAPFPTKKTRP